MAVQIGRPAESLATEFTFLGRGLVYQVVVSDAKAPLFGTEPQRMADAILACFVTGRWPCKFERVEPF